MSTKYFGFKAAVALTNLKPGSFRVYASTKGVKGQKRGREVFYTKTQINQIMAGKR